MTMTKHLAFTFLLIFALGACVPSTPAPAPTNQASPGPTPVYSEPQDEQNWWTNAVFYEIFVRSFYDTNNDGIGDFNGITEKLDYLQDLGITGIWLLPIHPSPAYHGYNVVNYFAVHHEYGTMEDFKKLLAEAHKRDMRIVIDLVINHTSAQHPIFIDANSNPDSPYRDWYVWSDQSGNGWHQSNLGFYYGQFWDPIWGGIPDLNYNNPEVTDFMNRVVEYWLTEVGVDGFRVDAAKHLIEQGGQTENTPATHDWYRGFYATLKTKHPTAYLVGEVWGAGAFIATTYENQFDHVFNFELSSGIMNSVNGEANSGINSAWTFTLKDIEDGKYATFLTNHDQTRVMSALNGKEDKAKLAAFMLLTSPGTPYIYYGEEIGMQGRKAPGDEDIRLPMQWSREKYAGFSGSEPWREPDPNYLQVNVALQENDPSSLLSYYRQLIQLRQEHPALRSGRFIEVETDHNGVYATLRSDGVEHLLILANLTASPISDYGLTVSKKFLADSLYLPVALFGNATAASINTESIFGYKPIESLPPYQAYIYQIK